MIGCLRQPPVMTDIGGSRPRCSGCRHCCWWRGDSQHLRTGRPATHLLLCWWLSLMPPHSHSFSITPMSITPMSLTGMNQSLRIPSLRHCL